MRSSTELITPPVALALATLQQGCDVTDGRPWPDIIAAIARRSRTRFFAYGISAPGSAPGWGCGLPGR